MTRPPVTEQTPDRPDRVTPLRGPGGFCLLTLAMLALASCSPVPPGMNPSQQREKAEPARNLAVNVLGEWKCAMDTTDPERADRVIVRFLYGRTAELIRPEVIVLEDGSFAKGTTLSKATFEPINDLLAIRVQSVEILEVTLDGKPLEDIVWAPSVDELEDMRTSNIYVEPEFTDAQNMVLHERYVTDGPELNWTCTKNASFSP